MARARWARSTGTCATCPPTATEAQRATFRRWFVSDDPDDPAWLERQLAARDDETCKIVAMHHQPISFGNRAGQWYGSSWKTDMRDRLVRLFQEYGVRVVFGGHEHLYGHNTMRCEHNGQPRAMHFVTSSSGGGALRDLVPQARKDSLPQRYRRAGFRVEHHRQERRFHYSLVDVTGERMRIRTYAVPRDSETAARDTSLLDTVTIPRDPSQAATTVCSRKP